MATFFDYGHATGTDRDLVFLGDLDVTQWARIAGFMERRRFGAGDTVMARGEADRAVYVVASGSVEILVAERTRERRVLTQGPGTVLGEVGFFDGRPRSATVRALTAAEVLRLGPDRFEALAARHPDLGRRLVLELGRILAVRLRRAEAQHG